MKTQRSHSQLKDQENSLERTNNKTDIFQSTRSQVQKGGNKNTEGLYGWSSGPVVNNSPANTGGTGPIPGPEDSTRRRAAEPGHHGKRSHLSRKPTLPLGNSPQPLQRETAPRQPWEPSKQQQQRKHWTKKANQGKCRPRNCKEDPSEKTH